MVTDLSGDKMVTDLTVSGAMDIDSDAHGLEEHDRVVQDEVGAPQQALIEEESGAECLQTQPRRPARTRKTAHLNHDYVY